MARNTTKGAQQLIHSLEAMKALGIQLPLGRRGPVGSQPKQQPGATGCATAQGEGASPRVGGNPCRLGSAAGKPLSREQHSQYRTTVGQLLWVSQLRTDIAYA
eukprot:6310845-Amphidinium_carterae.1